MENTKVRNGLITATMIGAVGYAMFLFGKKRKRSKDGSLDWLSEYYEFRNKEDAYDQVLIKKDPETGCWTKEQSTRYLTNRGTVVCTVSELSAMNEKELALDMEVLEDIAAKKVQNHAYGVIIDKNGTRRYVPGWGLMYLTEED